MFNLNQLQYFRLVAQLGNFAAAARQAHITQPALSNSIRNLEERVGVQLFDRSERPVRLTAVGRDLLNRVDSLLAEARNLEKEVGYLAQGMAGELRIGMTAQSSGSMGGMILGLWQTANPAMSADVTVADTPALLELLRAENLDLMIGDGRDLPANSSELEMVPLPREDGRAFCRAGHPVLAKRYMDFEDLLPYRFAGAHLSDALLDSLTEHFDLGDRSAIEFGIKSDNIAILRDAVIHSDLILLSTPGCVRNEMAAGLIEELPIDPGEPAIWFSVTLKKTAVHPAMASLREAIEKATRRV
ncbi:LysR family transcriptional regulator [Congregibacter variabilis]|uniref:LysR family transcriptional regulator n=1 Tax=Congregibacter variabilis TaxID=3081200 RepID=A0ABZ0I6M2_9GAMM|nr:LysR family transcriptional regulator [Congregibacter sp. IMCC43200]